MSVYFSHTGYADHHVGKFTEQSRSTRLTAKNAYRFWEETSTPSLGPGYRNKCTSVGKHTHTHTQQRQQERRLDETLADVTKFHSTQHDAQEDSWETNDLQISKRKWDANRLHHNPEKTLEIQQRCRSQRHDPHWQWPQMCHGNIRDHNSKERWHTLKKRQARDSKTWQTRSNWQKT